MSGHRALGVLAIVVSLVVLVGAADPPSPDPAQNAGAQPAATSPPGSSTLPPPVREVLPNGLRLIVQEHRSSEIVAIYMFTRVGVRYDKPEELGYSHFMEHMLFKGAGAWGPGFFDRTVEGVGGRSNAYTTFDYTVFDVLVPRDSLATGVRLLADMAFRATFASDQIDRERQVIFEEARLEADNPRSAIIRQLYGLVFDGNPYGRPVLGTHTTLDGANHDRLLAYYHHFYTPENMALVVVGPVEPAAVRALVDQTFGAVPSHALAPTPAAAPSPLAGVVARTVERPEQRAVLAMGWQAPRSENTEGDAVDLVTTILAGDESSRLSRRLRDQEQLVDDVSMNYTALVGGGIVTLQSGLAAKDVDRVERIIREEIDKLAQGGPTDRERERAVIKFEADHAFDTETSEGLADAYGVAETTWTLDAELHYVERLRRITSEQIRDAARRYLATGSYARIAFVPKPAR